MSACDITQSIPIILLVYIHTYVIEWPCIVLYNCFFCDLIPVLGLMCNVIFQIST